MGIQHVLHLKKNKVKYILMSLCIRACLHLNSRRTPSIEFPQSSCSLRCVLPTCEATLVWQGSPFPRAHAVMCDSFISFLPSLSVNKSFCAVSLSLCLRFPCHVPPAFTTLWAGSTCTSSVFLITLCCGSLVFRSQSPLLAVHWIGYMDFFFLSPGISIFFSYRQCKSSKAPRVSVLQSCLCQSIAFIT